MKIQLKGHTGSGSSHVPLNFINLGWYDNTPFNFRTNLIPVLKRPDHNDILQRVQLELTWKHWIIFKGKELFEFHSYSEYYLSETSIEATIEQLENIIIESYSYLKKSFEERRKEFYIFEEMKDLDESAIFQSVSQLNSFLNQIH